MNDTRSEHVAEKTWCYCKTASWFGTSNFLCGIRNSFCVAWSARMLGYFLVLKFTGVLPLSALTFIAVVVECSSKAPSMYRTVCPSLLLTHTITLSENSCTAFTKPPRGLRTKSWCSYHQFKEVLSSFDGRMTTEPAFEINFQTPFFSPFFPLLCSLSYKQGFLFGLCNKKEKALW